MKRIIEEEILDRIANKQEPYLGYYQVYGQFICTECGSITHQKFLFEDRDDAACLNISTVDSSRIESRDSDLTVTNVGLYTNCKACGKEHITITPSKKMLATAKLLASKGYHINMLYQDSLSVILNDDVVLPEGVKIPKEFVLDTSVPGKTLIYNGRMSADDWEGIDNIEEYKEEALFNLYGFVFNLPTIKTHEKYCSEILYAEDVIVNKQ